MSLKVSLCLFYIVELLFPLKPYQYGYLSKAYMLLVPKVQIAIRISRFLTRLAVPAHYAYLALNEIIVHFPIITS